MKRTIRKADPLVRFLIRWKKTQGMKATTLDSLKTALGGGRAMVQTKIDGELEALYFDGRKAYFAALGGGIREDVPALEEAARLLKRGGAGKTVILGELTGVDAQGKPLHFNDTISIIRNPAGYGRAHGISAEEAQRRIVFHPFELALLGGKKLDNHSSLKAYLSNFARLKHLIAGARYLKPMRAQIGNASAIAKFYDTWVEQRGAEGVVVRRQNGSVYKIKKVLTYDLAVIGVTPGKGKHKGRLGALVVAWGLRERTGRIHYGYATNVGTGFSDQDRAEIWRWAQANPAKLEDGRAPTAGIVWVKPQRVYEIEWERINPKMVRAYEYSGGLYKEAEPEFAVSLAKPRATRRREDKKATRLYDIRLAQIADFEKLKGRFGERHAAGAIAERVFQRTLIALF